MRVGTGGDILLTALMRPTDHLGLDIRLERRWIDETLSDRSGRLFTADVARLKAVYVFTPQLLLRLIGQYEDITSDPALWIDPVPRHDGGFAGSALLSYKLNWQSVLFVGYGDARALDETGTARAGGKAVLHQGVVRVPELRRRPPRPGTPDDNRCPVLTECWKCLPARP